MKNRETLSIVCPVFNEESGILEFCATLRKDLDESQLDYEVILVDDGSTDKSLSLILTLDWERCTVISLARNVGHQVALEAGTSQATGEFIITMDADGQHPSSLITQMYNVAKQNALDVVYTRRKDRKSDSFLKRTPALSYYRFVRWLTDVPIGDRQADFRLVSRRALKEIELVNGEKVVRLLLPSIGFRSQVIEYDLQPRIAGKGHFGLGRQIRLATDSALNFSSKPLRLVTAMGWILSILSFLWLAAVLITWIAKGAIEGWTSVMSAVLLVGGMSLLAMSIIGAYIARIHDIVKQQPLYFIDRKIRLGSGEQDLNITS